MKKRVMILSLFFVAVMGMAMITLNLHTASATGPIYIRSDGSIEGTDKIQRVGDVFTFTGNIVVDWVSGAGLKVERSNIVIDGNGFMLESNNTENGLYAEGVNNVTVRSLNVYGFYSYGIYLSYSNNSLITMNNVTANQEGIHLEHCMNCTISRNTVTLSTECGVSLEYSANNTITSNTIMENLHCGLELDNSSYNIITSNDIIANGVGIKQPEDYSVHNLITHNNLVNNTYPAESDNSMNDWDDGYEGNYWGNFTGAHDPDEDGVSEDSYSFNPNVTTIKDDHPLMGMHEEFEVEVEQEIERVETICNSTITSFMYNGSAIKFEVSGPDGSKGFCRICVLSSILNGTYRVYVDDIEVEYHNVTSLSNSTHTYLYFSYTHSTHGVTIVPEFPEALIVPLMMAATLIPIVLYKKKRLPHKLQT